MNFILKAVGSFLKITIEIDNTRIEIAGLQNKQEAFEIADVLSQAANDIRGHFPEEARK